METTRKICVYSFEYIVIENLDDYFEDDYFGDGSVNMVSREVMERDINHPWYWRLMPYDRKRIESMIQTHGCLYYCPIDNADYILVGDIYVQRGLADDGEYIEYSSLSGDGYLQPSPAFSKVLDDYDKEVGDDDDGTYNNEMYHLSDDYLEQERRCIEAVVEYEDDEELPF